MRRLQSASMETILFGVAFALYFFSTAGYLLSILVKKVMPARISTWIMAAAFVFLSVYLLIIIISYTGSVKIGSREFFSFCAWITTGVYLAFQMRTKTRILGSFISPVILLLLIAAAGKESGRSLVPEEMLGWLTLVHIFLVIAGEALFILASCAGAMFIIQNNLLKNKKPGRMSRLLPALHDLDRINHLGLLWGFPILTAGIFAGIVFAGHTWESGWLMDPKVLWTAAAWVCYGFLLHQRLAIGWRGIRMAFISCAVLVLLLISYSGVKFCFSTLHDFI